MSVFVHAQGIKTAHAMQWGGGGKQWQISVHVVVEYPLSTAIEGLISIPFSTFFITI